MTTMTLSPEAAHNAVGALMGMYTGILADKNREMALATQELTKLRTELEGERIAKARVIKEFEEFKAFVAQERIQNELAPKKGANP